jgi:hypothetical protein
MSFASNLVVTARRLVQKYGQSMSFSRVVEGSFVPSTGAVGAGTTSSYTAYGVPITYDASEIDNLTIMENDLRVIVEVNVAGNIPLVGDVVTIDGQAYRVLSVKKTVAQSVSLIYTLQVRI